MSSWARINEENVVDWVVRGLEQGDSHAWLVATHGGNWIKCSYNTKGGIHYDSETHEPSPDQSKALRKNFPGKGYVYDEERDAFIPPKPFDSWVLDEETCLWVAPVEIPDIAENYVWDEDSVAWVELVPETPEA